MLNLVFEAAVHRGEQPQCSACFSLSLPLKPQRGLSFLMKYSPNDLPGPCCSNHSQGKYWSDERAPALPVGAFTVAVALTGQEFVSQKFHTLSLVLVLPSLWFQQTGKHKAKTFGSLFTALFMELLAHIPPPPIMQNILYYLAKNTQL